MAFSVPERVVANCARSPERLAWLSRLPHVVEELRRRWSLTIGVSFDGAEVSCASVGRVQRVDGEDAVLKVGMPHMEGQHEIAGLRFWNGDPTVRLLDADEELGAMLIERCEPGSTLRSI